MKKIFILLSLLGIAELCFAQNVPTGLQYETVNGNSVTITKYTGNAMSVVIPDRIQGLPVTSIGKIAFLNSKNLTSVTIPDSVTSIGDSAFYGSSLTNVTIPNSVISIENGAFMYCSNLTSVTIGNSVTSIGNSAFYGSSLTSVTIPDSVTSIGRSAFYLCTSLTNNVTIPKSVTSIGEAVFASCTKLTSITVDERNTAYISIDGVLFNKAKTILLIYPAGKQEKTYTIPAGVISIGDLAFIDCQMTSVTIPNSVTSIGIWAFRNNKLSSITIPDRITFIDKMVFYKNRLTSVTIPSSVTNIFMEAFADNQITNVTIVARSGTWRFDYKGDFDWSIPQSTVHLSQNAFKDNPITSITLGDDVSLGNGASLAFPQNDFHKFYYAQNRKAGTFVLSNGEWRRQ